MRRSSFNRRVWQILRMAAEANQRKQPEGEAVEYFEAAQADKKRKAWDRRQLIRNAAAGVLATALPLGACKSVAGKKSNLRDEDSLNPDTDQGGIQGGLKNNSKDLVIIGGGLAGLTCAYRLQQVGFGCRIFEASERLGGRVYSARNFNGDGQFCELGAELVDTTNYDLLEIAQELGLTAEGYQQTDPLEGEGELFYFKGKVYTEKDLFIGLRPFLASVQKDLGRIFPDGEVYWPSYTTQNSPILISYDNMSMADYFDSKRGVAEAWVLDVLRKAYETEYGGMLARQSALNFICLADINLADGYTWYGASDEWGRIRGGNQGLVDGLESQLKGKIAYELGHELVAIRASGSEFLLTFKTGTTTKELKATRVVCALPFSVLRKVDGLRQLGFSPLKHRSIQELAYGTNAKFMTSFSSRLWRQPVNSALPPSQAVVITDLPGGQYWETSRAQAGKAGIITNFMGGVQGARVTETHVQTILNDLNTMWPGLKDLHDGKAQLKAWTREKFALGSYSSPSPGQYTSFIGIEGEPELNGRFLFIGEHASADWIGYMNGAIQTGNRAAYSIAGKTLSKITAESGQGNLSLRAGRKRTRLWKKKIRKP